jgi:hypothetical protein
VSADLDALATELARLDILIEAEMRRMRARYELSLDEFRGLYITDERVEALLRTSADPPRFVPDISLARAADTESRWHQLAVALELTDDERDILLVCLAPELDPKYETLYAYLNDDVTRRMPTPDLAGRLLGRDTEHRRLLCAGLNGGSRVSALTLEFAPTGRDATMATRGMRTAAPLVPWLQGLRYFDHRLDGVAHSVAPTAMPLDALPAAARPQLAEVVHRLESRTRTPVVIVASSAPADARLVAEHLVAAAGRMMLVVDLEAHERSRSAGVADAIELAQRVLGLVAVVHPSDRKLDADDMARDELSRLIGEIAQRSPAAILTASESTSFSDLQADAGVVEIRLSEPTTNERASAWTWAVGTDVGTRKEVLELADRFAIGSASIVRAARRASEIADIADRPPSMDDLYASARSMSNVDSGGTTSRLSTLFDWEDLVLPVDARQRLEDVVRAIELRAQVLDTWGFSRAMGGVRGIKVLFAGPPGTGKTMAAGIVARTLGIDLHRVELGATVSKYIGETEKNLDRAFDAARRGNALLFMDEADALFGKRSEVKDAHDRYANIEIAYLLQKMEDHDGIVILATNLAKNVDEAFSRRMQFVIEFPMPDEQSRERIWRAMIPPSAPLDSDVDLAYLARQFEFTGADIRNVVMEAAYQAAQQGHSITLLNLLRAVAHQFTKSGRVPTAMDFREHYALLDAGQAASGLTGS